MLSEAKARCQRTRLSAFWFPSIAETSDGNDIALAWVSVFFPDLVSYDPTLMVRDILRAIVPQTVKKRLTELAWQRLGISYELPSRLTVEIKRLGDWWVYNDVWAKREYDAAINLALDRIPADRPLRVVDLGANVGMFTLRLFDLMFERGIAFDRASVLMVEGSPICCGEIEKRLARQPIPRSSFTIINGLVGERSGFAFLDESGEPALNTVANKGTRIEYIDVAEHVKASIDLLKCDIEGSEESFLANYPELIKKTDVLVVELDSTQCDVEHCRKLLAEYPNTRQTTRHGSESVEMFWR